jgi:hypothetical protein
MSFHVSERGLEGLLPSPRRRHRWPRTVAKSRVSSSLTPLTGDGRPPARTLSELHSGLVGSSCRRSRAHPRLGLMGSDFTLVKTIRPRAEGTTPLVSCKLCTCSSTGTNGHPRILMNGSKAKFLDDGGLSVLRGTYDYGEPPVLRCDPNERHGGGRWQPGK